MNKRKWIIVFFSIFSITAILVIIGVLFNKSEFEKLQGLTGVYDVSTDDLIAYVFYEDGESVIYLHENNRTIDRRLVHLEATDEILDLSFSPDGSSFAYVVNSHNHEVELQSTVHLFDLESMDEQVVFHDASLITEIKFDPKEENILFYLRASTFENYSPIARARPHEFDLFSYQIADDKRKRHTNLDKYSMSSLQISAEDQVAFIQMDDDLQAQSAEDIFDSSQKIFRIPLDNNEEISAVSPIDRPADVYDFTIIPGKTELIFQSASNFNSNDSLFQYELYHYNWKKEVEETQLTFLKESASKPKVSPTETIYFLVNKQFGQEYPDYHLYEMDFAGENIEEVFLKQNELEE